MPKNHYAFARWMGPILDALRELDGSGKPREVSEWIAEHQQITENTLEATLKSGQSRFYNQLHWARQYLVWEGLLDGSIRGVWTLTPKGFEARLSDEDAQRICLKWVRIHASAQKQADEGTGLPSPVLDEPEEDDYRQVLLEVLKNVTPQGFERICALLLRQSGFEKVTVTGRPNDGGIDGIGILQVNPFVTFKVLFQCKRYKGSVSRAQVGDFRNAMIGRAEKGIILTTGTFTTEARREAERDGAPPVELIDGENLVDMFQGVKLGVKQKTVYEVDHAFFADFLPDS